MRMENLVKGSQTLTDTLNDVLNENWKDVWTELSSGVNDVLSQCFDNSISSVFDKLSYDDFYAET